MSKMKKYSNQRLSVCESKRGRAEERESASYKILIKLCIVGEGLYS